MKSQFINAVYGILTLWVTLIVASTAEAGTDQKQLTLGNLGQPNVCLVESVVDAEGDRSMITFRTLKDDDTWSCFKQSLVPHRDHFVGEIFIGVQAPKGWIFLDRYSRKNSATYKGFVRRIHDAGSAKGKVVLQTKLLRTIDKQKSIEKRNSSMAH